jgi:hypothetical protein
MFGNSLDSFAGRRVAEFLLELASRQTNRINMRSKPR